MGNNYDNWTNKMMTHILPTRKPNRLQGYNYSSNGVYFITICTAQKRCTLSEIRVGADIIRPPVVSLTDLGRLTDDAIRNIPKHYKGVGVDKYVIMPNHIHLLLRLENDSGRMVSAPTVIGSLKRFVSKTANHSVWQKGFYDRVVRSEEEYIRKWEYIDSNPSQWLLKKDEYYFD